jgi:xanthine phosphoribosyltransferase
LYSFTKQRTFTITISKRFLVPNDAVLLVGDFLASGQALLSLTKIVHQAGASLAGAGIVIEKAFQRGKGAVEDEGIEVYSLPESLR